MRLVAHQPEGGGGAKGETGGVEREHPPSRHGPLCFFYFSRLKGARTPRPGLSTLRLVEHCTAGPYPAFLLSHATMKAALARRKQAREEKKAKAAAEVTLEPSASNRTGRPPVVSPRAPGVEGSLLTRIGAEVGSVPTPDSPTVALVSAAAAALAPPPPSTRLQHRHLSPEPVLLSEPSFSVHSGTAGGLQRSSLLASPARTGDAATAVARTPSPPPPGAAAADDDEGTFLDDFLFAADSLHEDAPASLAAPGRSFTIVTTAALPWLTGTAVNPALRAAYLARALPRSKVRLLLPWLAPADQARVFPPSLRFASPAAQQEWVRAWLVDRMGLKSGANGAAGADVASLLPAFDFVWYQGRYDQALCSIFPYGNLIDLVPEPERDVAILEEPEHLTWYHHGPRWSDAFGLAIGVAHTNYVDYVRAAKGAAAARVLRAANAALVGAHCHRVVKLSGAVQRLPRQVTCFVHGVAPVFLQAGRAGGAAGDGGGDGGGEATATGGCYFLGKALLAKGWANLLELLDPTSPDLPVGASPPSVDGFGSGEDAEAIADAARTAGAPLAMHPGIDHLAPALRPYRVFLNPSTSDVVATTSAEALAMGRWLVVPRHPCNAFFAGFTGCLVYDTHAEFHAAMATALASPPPRLTAEEARALTWQAATERFLEVAAGPVDGATARGVRRSPSEDAGFCSDGPGGVSGSGLPRGGSGAASAAALSALAPGDDRDDVTSSSFGLGLGLGQGPPPSALGHALLSPPHHGTAHGAPSADGGGGGGCDPQAASPHNSTSRGMPRSASTLAFAPDPPPVKARPSNPASRLVGAAKAALGAAANRAFEAASGVEAVRRVMGAGAFTRDAPPAPPGAFDPADRAALAASAAGREAAADAHARLGYPRPRYVG